LGQRPHQGHSPKVYGNSTAGHSHRREANSGGRAESDAHDFLGKLMGLDFTVWPVG